MINTIIGIIEQLEWSLLLLISKINIITLILKVMILDLILNWKVITTHLIAGLARKI